MTIRGKQGGRLNDGLLDASKIAAKEPLSIELVKLVHLPLTAGTYDEQRFIENEERPGEVKKTIMSRAYMR